MVVQAVIEVSSDEYYSCDLTRKLPVRVTIVTINGETGLGLIESEVGGTEALESYVHLLETSSSTVSVEVTYKSSDVYWTRVVHRMGGESIYETILTTDCMTKLPIVIEKGFQRHVILAPTRDALRQLLHELRSRFTRVAVKRVSSVADSPFRRVLTPKQREAFDLAHKSGYYQLQKRPKLSDLCEVLGIKRVAMQERLRRAESRIMDWFSEEHM
jgi:predicted DNA binding protein